MRIERKMSEEYKAIPASVHRARKRCCKSACLHCPYGHTLKQFGLTFKPLVSFDDPQIKLFSGLDINSDTYQASDYEFIYLKDILCGFMRKDKLFVRELSLLVEFQDQGLDKAVVESYYFY
jgi:hypothetical protein